jgi:N-acetylneuraminate synthase
VAKEAEGGDERIVDEVERTSLLELQRGVYAKRKIKKGDAITSNDVYRAFPPAVGQWTSGEFIEGVAATHDFEPDEPISRSPVEKPEADLVRAAVVQARMMINAAGAMLPKEFKWELSHHYGMRNYDEVGLTVIEVVNFEYCHKLLVVFPGQGNPLHYHRIKKETFRVIGGELDTECDSKRQVLRPGDLFTVVPGVWHQFRSARGCVFEEISTTQLPDDSFYQDESISKRSREDRKTRVLGTRRS